jgi:hypothetical protein
MNDLATALLFQWLKDLLTFTMILIHYNLDELFTDKPDVSNPFSIISMVRLPTNS